MKSLHRIRLAAMLTGLAAVILFGNQAAYSSTCGYLNGPKTATMTVVGNEYKSCSSLPGLPGYLDLTLSGLPADSKLANGVYAGNCVDLRGNILDSQLFGWNGTIVYTVDFWSSLDPNLPTAVKQVTDSQNITYTIPWDKINYLLNKYPGESWLNIQAAFWNLVHGCTQAPGELYTCGSLRQAPYYFPYGGLSTPYGCPSSTPLLVDESRVAFLVSDANANGAGFVPNAGDHIAIVGQITNCTPASTCNNYMPYQIFLVQSTCPTCDGTVGDFVWKDLDGNGLQNTGEPGIPGVELKLTGADIYGQNLNLTTTTDQNGKYQFNNLCASKDKYTVTLNSATVPAGLVVTTPRSSSGDDNIPNDSNEPSGTTVTITTDNSSNMTLDFGYISACSGSIGDFVWEDLNGNGVQDTGEPGILGVTVSLNGTSGYGIPVSMNTVTDGNGKYNFSGLCQGNYTVTVGSGIPAGFVPTISHSANGNDLTPDDSNNPAGTTVNLPTDSSVNPTLDFGYVPNCQGVIGDYVWKDFNGNGTQDASEPGIPNVGISLAGTNGYGQAVSMTTTTNSSGIYTFNGLCKGNYTVSVNPSTIPQGWGPTSPLSANGNDLAAIDSNKPTGTTVNLASDTDSNLTVDFGYVPICTGSIGDFVWYDKNVNGIQDDGSGSGINGVQVQLTGTNIYGQSVNSTFTTVNGGFYQFTNLCQGNYSVTINSATVPAGFVPTSPRSTNGNDLTGNDSNEPIGTAVSLPNDSTSNQTVDFGYYLLAPAIKVTESCTNAPAPGQPMVFKATISNTGNETLTGISCTDGIGGTVTLADIIVGASVDKTFNYTGTASPMTDSITCSAKGAISNTAVTSAPATASCTSTCIPCLNGANAMTLAINTRTSSADVTERVRVRVGALGGTVLYDSWNDADTTHKGLAIGQNFSFTVPTGTTQIVVTLQGSQHPSEFVKATITTKCNLVVGSIQGAYPSYITFKVVNASFDGSTTCAPPPVPSIKVTESCVNSPAPGQPIVFTAAISNTGNETLTGISCSDAIGGTVTLADIIAGASVTKTFNYTGTTSPKVDTITCSAKGAISNTAVTSTPATASCTSTCIPCLKGATSMTLAIKTRTSSADVTERVRVRVGALGGTVLYDSWNDADTTHKGLAIGQNFSFTVPTGTTQIVVTLQGSQHPSEFVKATITTKCDLVVGSIQGAYPSYITFKVVNATFDGSTTCTPICIPCLKGAVSMTLAINTRTSTADVTEHVRVRVGGLGGTVLYDSWNDTDSTHTGLAVGQNFSFTVPTGTTQIVVTLQGSQHPSEFIKATISTKCDLVVGSIQGAYPSYITFKVVNATFDGSTACSVTPVASGDAATIGFWHNNNGQALIKSLNGGSNAKSLANWLATNFPYLYGPKSANDMTGKTNNDVAALFMTMFNVTGTKTNAQTLAVALAIYVSDSDLSGTAAISYGFNISTSGTGAKTYNVGTNGSNIDLQNNTSYSVIVLLQQANLMKKLGTYDAAAFNAFNAIFNGINTTGDI